MFKQVLGFEQLERKDLFAGLMGEDYSFVGEERVEENAQRAMKVEIEYAYFVLDIEDWG